MTYTASYPITVDGVRLDTLAYNITEISMGVSGLRTRDIAVPGLDGEVPSLNDDRTPAMIGLQMMVRGTDYDGLIPGGRESLSVLRDNLDELTHLFGKRHALIEYRRKVKEDGTERRAWVKVADTIEPTLTPGSVATYAVSFTVPAGCWEDTATSALSWVVVSGTPQTLTNLSGGTERIADAVLTLTGPADSGVRLTDTTSGQWVQLNTAIPAGQVWRINAATWASRMAAGLTTTSPDTTGTDQTAVTTWGGGGPQLLALTPARTAQWTRTYQITPTGTGFTGATALAVRAARKYRL